MSDFDVDLSDFLKDCKEFTNLKRLKVRDVKGVGNKLIDKMKEEIARGLSPISRKKFPPYKNPEKYPGDKKAHAPVNLELTGAMLSDLTLRSVDISPKDISLEIAYRGRLSPLKEKGHREGVHGQPKRPTLPEGRENFSDFLTKELEASYVRLIEEFDV